MSVPTFDLKSTRLDALLLPLTSRDWPAVLPAMQAQWAGASSALLGELLLLDLRELPLQGPPVPWQELRGVLGGLGLNLVGALGLARLTEAEQEAALAVGLLARDEAAPARVAPAPQPEPAVASATPPLPGPAARGPRCLVVDRPLRSGQQVYARDADLVVLGLVSHGAEVIADGHVHVYGALRGRAIAGAKGDTEARIYAQSLEAELLALAGVFRTSEKPLPPEVAGKPAQVRLDGERLVFEALKY